MSSTLSAIVLKKINKHSKHTLIYIYRSTLQTVILFLFFVLSEKQKKKISILLTSKNNENILRARQGQREKKSMQAHLPFNKIAFRR